MSGAARRVLVTGAGGGLGLAIAEALARSGDEAIGTVRGAERAAARAAQARERGLALDFLPLDYEEPGGAEALARALEARGGVDAVVHNAGFGLYGALEETDAAAVARQYEVNLLGPVHLTRLLLPGLRARRGRIVWIGSLAGRLALPFQSHYSATKAAIAALSDAMRLELAPFGVRVSCVEPGDFATGFTQARECRPDGPSLYGEPRRRCLAAVEQQERAGAHPREVADAVVRLLRMRRPPARRPVGRWARTICLLHRVLPDALREALVRRQYRLAAGEGDGGGRARAAA